MEERIFITKSADETRKLGKEFSKELKKGVVISLAGNLGSGKTTFTQGLAQGLGVEGRIISPTFVLVRRHKGNGVTLYHIDLYRMENEKDIRSLGLDEILEDEEGIFVIEWAKRHNALSPQFEISFENNGDERKITIKKNE